MKQHLTLIITLLIGCIALSQSTDTKWADYEDNNVGYAVKYPEHWVIKGAKRGFMCGKKEDFINAEWIIWISKPNNKERIDFIFNHDGLYEGYDMVEDTININGVEALRTTVTHKEKPDEFIQYIVIKTKRFWYQIENSGKKDENFETFYQSFRLLK
ncbi:hypothetical protein [Psychroserpens sp.]|uniref:hypothetical protein n=1 Tax=Psychroserpens sp. TaxID=2020870 RepID=UPI001AFE3827|nr:hypothetical protein [Psychroserpens sp.]MBO6606118.1 hypothetical protein [Psychroserpens sp.]MBO6630744.1 hypothetical protein [Psychroserpens sp.]MBO6652511.1 hypothetical protein [Psychroserpens sp.]MBO6681717.1 hypothetical protein [Psychroserpens sp.]MBO6749492.1 hypothetical protein [Psychroserpens sp.]